MKTVATEKNQGQGTNWTQVIASWVVCLSLQSATHVLEITEDASVFMIALNATIIWAAFSLLQLIISSGGALLIWMLKTETTTGIWISLAIDGAFLLVSGLILTQIFQLSQTPVHLGIGWLTALGTAHATGTQQFRRALFH